MMGVLCSWTPAACASLLSALCSCMKMSATAAPTSPAAPPAERPRPAPIQAGTGQKRTRLNAECRRPDARYIVMAAAALRRHLSLSCTRSGAREIACVPPAVS